MLYHKSTTPWDEVAEHEELDDTQKRLRAHAEAARRNQQYRTVIDPPGDNNFNQYRTSK
jgi:hypothetical protein